MYLVIQMTKICFSYYIFGLPQFLAHSCRNSWKFLNVESDKVLRYEVTSGST